MKLRNLITMLLLAFVATVQAQQVPLLPRDPATKYGKLDNGLTYYVRHNAYPEKVANFYIAQRVGSIQENDDQRGLAHFLEHMAFNGSRHFQENGLIEYLRTLGVAFGKDLNAYTSIEETVYNIDNVPTTRQSALDSCLFVLQDWSNGLLLKTEEIDKERGVIHGEWSMRSSANQRLFERALPLLYPNCKYGYRLPIGTMEVVDNFKPQELRDYYEKWYHPENQAIVVIGDIDVDYTVNKIKELFSDIKKGPNAASVTPTAVPDNNEAIYVFDKDKEMQYSVMSLMMKSDPMPQELRGTQLAYVQNYMTSLMSRMFSSRASEMSLDPNCPFINLSMGYGNYILSKTKEAFSFDVVAKEGKEKEAFTTMIREVKRIKDFGFTGSEFVRAKEAFMAEREKEYSNRDKRLSKAYINECVRNFLDGDPMPGAEIDYQLWQALSQAITLDMINQQVKAALTLEKDTNLVCYSFAREVDGAAYCDVDQMKSIIAQVRNETLQPWVDNVKDEPLISQMPKAGKITKETKNETLGYTELTLSNGAKVVLKKTDFKNDEILFSGFAPGGSALYGEKDYSNLRLFEYVINTVGLGNFTNNELEKALAAKQVSITPALDTKFSRISGKTTPKDLETLMQLFYLYFTAPQKDEKAYTSLMNALETALKNRDLQPSTQMSDSIAAYMYNHNPRFANLTVNDLKNVSLDRIIEISRERFNNVNNFTFVIVGNFDETQIRQHLCQYVASLPGKEKAVKVPEVTTYFTGIKGCEFKRKMETPQPQIMQCLGAEIDFNLKNDILCDYAGEVLSTVLLKVVREEASLTYNIGAAARTVLTANGKARINVFIQSPIGKPEDVDKAIALIKECVDGLTKSADPEVVAKIKANYLKEADVQAKQNGYWKNVLEFNKKYGYDQHTDYKKIVESITPEQISEFFRTKIANSGNFINIVMRPE